MQYPGDPYLKQFGFEVDTSMVQVKGRVIQPPKLGYANNQAATAQNGVWDNRGKQFFRPTNIKNWAVLMFPPQNQCQSGDVKVSVTSIIVERSENEQFCSPLTGLSVGETFLI